MKLIADFQCPCCTNNVTVEIDYDEFGVTGEISILDAQGSKVNTLAHDHLPGHVQTRVEQSVKMMNAISPTEGN
jgi:hypothetical protein